MKKQVLLYNFEGERLSEVKRTLLPLKTAVRVVEKSDFHQTLGFLTGTEGFERNEAPCNAEFDEELLVMSGFVSGDIDALIRAFRNSGVKRVALKAIVTPTNLHWNGSELYRAVKEDHERMKK